MRDTRPTVLPWLARPEEFKARVRRVENKAVFEVPRMLEDILVRASDPVRHVGPDAHSTSNTW